MSEFTALFAVTAISLVLSSITVGAIHSPLRRLLEVSCPTGSSAEFWMRAAIMVFYLLPLWAVLAFALPSLGHVHLYSPGELARRGLAAASFALVLIVVATGRRRSSLRPPLR